MLDKDEMLMHFVRTVHFYPPETKHLHSACKHLLGLMGWQIIVCAGRPSHIGYGRLSTDPTDQWQGTRHLFLYEAFFWHMETIAVQIVSCPSFSFFSLCYQSDTLKAHEDIQNFILWNPGKLSDRAPLLCSICSFKYASIVGDPSDTFGWAGYSAFDSYIQ